SMEYGSTIVVPEAPEKEGYTFDGWGEVAETVPAGDVTYEGSYSVNSYLLTYVVDGETINVESIAYGTEITLLDEPVKEGYTFSGWSEVPEKMPAEDVTVSGFFTVNTYKVYYYVGEELVHTAEVAYGESIPEYVYETTVEGDEFMGWIGETYETMPAHDVTYTANITNEISQSTMGDSQLTIYDLNGRKIQVNGLQELSKGIYIINGKKVVIK
ncbi:MAG: InlB B-repeat-containing protein, partial [Bacteroidaceae bacterium]|nr:InlB B-repeat-containing protein [Bacteroidaceae bacterium]